MENSKGNTRVEMSMRTYLLLEMNNAHEEHDLLLFFRVTLAVTMAEVDVLMMLLFNSYNLSGTQFEALMCRQEL